MGNSYKIYASKDYVDSKGLPDGQGAYQQLVTGADSAAKWEERTHYESMMTYLPLQTVEGEPLSYQYAKELPISRALPIGENAVVTVDGVEYLGVFAPLDFSEELTYAFAPTPDASEPYELPAKTPEGEENVIAIFTGEGSTSVVVMTPPGHKYPFITELKIEAKGIKHLDGKYLADGGGTYKVLTTDGTGKSVWTERYGYSIPELDITWDGNMEGRAYATFMVGENDVTEMAPALVKVSDEILSRAQLIGSEEEGFANMWTTGSSYNMIIEEQRIISGTEALAHIWDMADPRSVAFITGNAGGTLELEVDGGVITIQIPESGTYLAHDRSDEYIYLLRTRPVVEKIPPEFLPEGFSGSYNDLTDTPNFHTIATTGSWNDLTDRPFGEEETLNEVLPLGDYEFDRNEVGAALYRASYINTDVYNAISGIGQTVIVVFDGVTYETTVQQIGTQEDIFSVTLNDGTILHYYCGSYTVSAFWLSSNEPGTHTMSVSLASNIITQIDEKYIPDTIARTEEVNNLKITTNTAQGTIFGLYDNSEGAIKSLRVTAVHTPENNGAPDNIIELGVPSGIQYDSTIVLKGGNICSAPAPTGLESYANYNGYISDVRDWSEGIDELHLARHSFTGSESLALFYDTPGVFSCNNFLAACAGSSNDVQYVIQSSHYRAVTRGELYNNLSTIHDTLNYCCGARSQQFVFVDSRFSTVDEFRTYLKEQYAAGTPVQILYVPAETTEVAIPDREYNSFVEFVLPNKVTVKGENSSNYIELEYWKDFIGKDYVDILNNRQVKESFKYVCPEDFGAYGDGVEYDDEAITACIEYGVSEEIPIKMYRNYRTSQPIMLENMDGINIEINNLEYTGSETALIVRDTRQAAIRVHSIISNGVGMRIDAVGRYACRNTISVDSITANGNCIELISESGKGLWQNRIDYRFLSAGNDGYCIHSRYSGTDSFVGENSYFGGQCAAGAWAFHINETDSKIYNPQLEGVSNGILLNCACRTSIYSPRYAELTTTTNGTVLKFVSDNYGSRFYGNEGFYLDNMDMSEASEGDATLSGAFLTTAPTYIDVPILKRTDSTVLTSGVPIAKGAYVVGKEAILMPMEKQRTTVTGSFIPGESSFYLPDIFTIGAAGCTITLPRSYCSLGHNDLIIDQSTEGYNVAITDYHGNVIFDGATLGAGVYRLMCAAEGRRKFDDPADTWTAFKVVSNDGLLATTAADAGKILRVQSDGTYALETLQTEAWTFTLDDGTEVVKNVVVL